MAHRNHRRSDRNLGKVLRPWGRTEYKMDRSGTEASLATGYPLVGFGNAWKAARTVVRSRLMSLYLTEEA